MLRPTVASALLFACAYLARADDVPALPATTRTSTTLPSADAVINRYVAVTGGRAAHAAVRTRRMTGVYTMPDLGVEGPFTFTARADGAGLLVIDLPTIGTFRQGVSASGVVWSTHPVDGPRILRGEDAAGVRRSLALAPELSLDNYTTADVVDVVALNGRPSFRMDLVDKTGTREQRFYDVESGLLVRTVATGRARPVTTRATSVATTATTAPELGPLTVATYFSDYTDVPPIRLPMRIRQAAFGLSPELIVRHVEQNMDLPDATFDPPAEVLALRRRPSATRPASNPATRGT